MDWLRDKDGIMMIHIKTNEDGRVCAVSDGFPLGDGELFIDEPEGFEFDEHRDWRVINGELIRDPLPIPQPINIMADLAEMVIDLTIEVETLKITGGAGNG